MPVPERERTGRPEPVPLSLARSFGRTCDRETGHSTLVIVPSMQCSDKR